MSARAAADPTNETPPRRPAGLRREAPLLLAAALTLFVVVAGATLVAYRGAVERLGVERERETAALAARMASEAVGLAPSRLAELAPQLPPRSELALLDAGGRSLATAGGPLDAPLPQELTARLVAAAPASIGPGGSGLAVEVAVAPLGAAAERRYVRLVVPAEALAAERRTLRLLTPLALGSLVVAGIVVALFFGAYRRPYAQLLARAQAAGAPAASEDELDFLVATFDRALSGLSEAERRRAREGLAEVVAQLGELAAGVAHELRNSVAAMRGWIELARRQPLPERAGECLEELDRESRALGRVTEDFLAFARPGSGRTEPLDLEEVVRAASADPSFAGVAVAVAAAAPGATLEGDRGLLERAIRNLVANAVDAERAAGRGGPVEVTLQRTAEGYRVEVADRGPGIPEALRPRLFSPFASSRPGGAGLGLALARRIVLLHGGSILARDRVGGGTLLEVQLPADVSATESV